jgi:hypothetical protein
MPNDEFERQVMMKGILQETLVTENTLSAVSNASETSERRGSQLNIPSKWCCSLE